LKKILKINKNFDIRLDKFLKVTYSSLTQGFIEKNVRKKNILINNQKTLSNYIVRKNDYLKILNFHEDKYKNKIVFKRNVNISNEEIRKFDKSIVFQNNNFLVLNKWSSIATQSGSKINISIDDIIKKKSSDFKLVHRLDKETSGLLIIAKNLSTAKIFGSLFKSNKIKKTYFAICEGVPKLNESLLDLNILDKNNRMQLSKTYYKLISSSNSLSLILFKPMTGKTHQLRIVSKKISAPIVGDNKYNSHSKFKNEILKLNACSLEFTIKEKTYKITSKFSEDFNNFLKKNNFKNIKNIKI
tara:strand:+ start:3604 stop:4503 length:900 start_codon:yes stop_codon:yes gene_type:complete